MAGVPEHSEQAPLLQGTRPGVRADASHRVMQGRRGLQIGRKGAAEHSTWSCRSVKSSGVDVRSA